MNKTGIVIRLRQTLLSFNSTFTIYKAMNKNRRRVKEKQYKYKFVQYIKYVQF